VRAVNLVGWDNGGGLTRDLDILGKAITEIGGRVLYNGEPKRAGKTPRLLTKLGSRARRVLSGASGVRPFSVNLHLERISDAWLPMASLNVLIPNQEWFREEDAPLLPAVDLVLCKTRHAEAIFRQMGKECAFLGFASEDRVLGSGVEHAGRPTCLHVAGKSLTKGTEAVLSAWSEHPEWPMLTVVRRAHAYGDVRVVSPRPRTPNVHLIDDFVEDHELRRMQNEHAIHLCPSEVEGFGHSLVEGCSCGAVVVTTDAPPMNELIQPERGVLVPYREEIPMRSGMRYRVDGKSLEESVQETLALSPAARAALGRGARQWFLESRDGFRDRLASLLLSRLGHHGIAP